MPTDQREVLRDFVCRTIGEVSDDQFDAIFTGAQMLARKTSPPVTNQDLRDMVLSHVTYASYPAWSHVQWRD